MDFVNSNVTMAIAIAVFISVLVIIHHLHKVIISNRRIYRMMLTCGIDEDTAKYAEQLLDVDMDAIRRRCQACPVPETCERWLNGAAVPSNEFCPNVWYFRRAAVRNDNRLAYDPHHRPGRRLDT
jgi:hypothetical protein